MQPVVVLDDGDGGDCDECNYCDGDDGDDDGCECDCGDNNIPSSPGCTDGSCGGHTASRFSMPLTSLGAKKYYLGIFFKVHTDGPNNLIGLKYRIRKMHIVFNFKTYLCRRTGTRLSNTAGSMVCIWQGKLHKF